MFHSLGSGPCSLHVALQHLLLNRTMPQPINYVMVITPDKRRQQAWEERCRSQRQAASATVVAAASHSRGRRSRSPRQPQRQAASASVVAAAVSRIRGRRSRSPRGEGVKEEEEVDGAVEEVGVAEMEVQLPEMTSNAEDTLHDEERCWLERQLVLLVHIDDCRDATRTMLRAKRMYRRMCWPCRITYWPIHYPA